MSAIRLVACFLIKFAVLAGTPIVPVAAAEKMPAGLVHLRTVDPTILQAIRYASQQNFTGEALSGYLAPECVIAERAAEALKQIQSELKPDGLSLKIFDCYRPKRAVAAIVDWAMSGERQPELKVRYYPKLEKRKLFPSFIARLSGHSRGGTVDLTLVDLDKAGSDEEGYRDGCGVHDGGAELDMGTGFDCFDSKSRTADPGISSEAKKNRRKLLRIMQRHGFRNYAGEWWHFTFNNEPYRRTYFDFPVTVAPERADDQ